MKTQHLIPILFLAAFCTVSAQTNTAPTKTNTPSVPTPEKATALSTDVVRVTPSPIEIILNCGNVYSHRFVYDTFDEAVAFGKTSRASTNIALQVIFRNVGERAVLPSTLRRNLSIVWDGKQYNQPLEGGYGGSEVPVSSHDTTRWYCFLSDFGIPAEARASGRHTIAVRDAFSETNTFRIPKGMVDDEKPNKIIFAESSTLTIFIDNAP